MNRYLCQCLAIVLALYVQFVASANVGDFCTFELTRGSGSCQFLSNCPPAIQNLKKSGVIPQRCGFHTPPTEPIICCSEVNGTRITPSKRQKRTTTNAKTVGPKHPDSLEVGEMSVQKCKEYGEFVYVLEAQEIIFPEVKPNRRADCGFVEASHAPIGNRVIPKEFPHMALIGFEGDNNTKEWICGGSLISEDFILVAAHCLFSKDYGDAKYIRLGDLDIKGTSKGTKPQQFNIKKVFPYPHYKPPSQYNEVGLIQMDGRANLNPYVRPICLNVDSALTTKQAIITGWKREDTSDFNSHLIKATVDYSTTAECNNTYKNNIGVKLRKGIVPETQVCAGCMDDSGGPLQVHNQEVFCTYKIVGVDSFGKGCGRTNFPGVYTLVSPFIEWIESVVWPQ